MNTLDDKDEKLQSDHCGKCTNCKCMNNEKFDSADVKINLVPKTIVQSVINKSKKPNISFLL